MPPAFACVRLRSAEVGTISRPIIGMDTFSPKLDKLGIAGVTVEKYSIEEVSPTAIERTRSAAIPNSAGSPTTVIIFGMQIKNPGLVPSTAVVCSYPLFNLADSIDWSTVRCRPVDAASDRTDHCDLFGLIQAGGVGNAGGHGPHLR